MQIIQLNFPLVKCATSLQAGSSISVTMFCCPKSSAASYGHLWLLDQLLFSLHLFLFNLQLAGGIIPMLPSR